MRLSASETRLSPWLLLFGFFTVGTVLLALLFALLYSVGAIGLLSEGLTLSHWREVLLSPVLWTSLWFSISLTAATILLTLFTALLAVSLLGRQLQQQPLAALLYLPLAIPGVIAALLSYQLFADSGLLARLATQIGVISRPDQFPSLIFDRYGVGILLTHWLMITPFFILFLQRLQQREQLPALRQQALMLGASEWYYQRRVAVPVLLRGALPVCAVYAVVLLAAFEVPLLIGARYPTMISVEIYQRIGQLDVLARPQGFAMAAVYLLLMSALWGFLFHLWQRSQSR